MTPAPAAHRPRVLMLGWEFPPHLSGGLGTACAGIARGLVAVGADVQLVLPRLFGDEDGGGARLFAAGDVPLVPPTAVGEGGPRGADELTGRLQLTYLDSPLRPYQTGRSYQALLRRLSGQPSGSRSAGAEASHPDARPMPFEGGYGSNLAAEVERYSRAVAELARRGDFDVIHAHDWMTYPAGLLARRVSGRPLVCHMHACEFDRSGADADPGIAAIEQAGLDGADRIVCVSHFTRGVLAENYRLDEDRTRVVYNAVTRREARTQRLKEENGRGGNGAPRVLFLGRLTRQKGPELFLRAAARVAEHHPTARFVVGGDGDLRETLVEQAAELGLARRVFFTGFLGPQEVERAYAEADLYVMPSVSEPFGIAPLEALSLDVPVLLSRWSGVAETLPSSPVVDPENVDDLAGQVLTLLEHPELRAALVRSGRAEAARLRWERSAAQLLSVYAEVSGQRG